jgi:uncharacterized phiE125 gp8 family phage protein
MRWTAAQPLAPLLKPDQVNLHLRLDGGDEGLYVSMLINAAVARAELVMQASLIERTITAVYYAGEPLFLPRGPVIAVTSVTHDGVAVDPSRYSIETRGTTDMLRYDRGTKQPHPTPQTLTVVYRAGYGPTAEDVPADIRHAILCHIGLMYECREVAAEGNVTPVPFLEDFYRLRGREGGIA